MAHPSDSLIVALDGTSEQAFDWADACQGTAGWMKVGLTLYYQRGPGIVRELLERGYQVFLDLKLNDIPHQVEEAAYVIAQLGVGMFTVHALGGPTMIRAAKRGALKGAKDAGLEPPHMLAVTILTSMDQQEFEQLGFSGPLDAEVVKLAKLAIESGADGIVCSPHEASEVRRVIGDGYRIVTPGVRPRWSVTQDQSRITTPSEAIAGGSTHLVVGRPITAHESPRHAAMMVLGEIEEALT